MGECLSLPIESAITMRLSSLCFLVVLVAFPLGGCDDDPAAPGVEPEIINSTESFEFQVSQVRNYSGTLDYTWSNSETAANIDESAGLSGGTVQLTVRDAAGTIVHDEAVTDGSVATDTGEAGDWTLRVRFEDASGTVNFRLQPRTP